MKPKKMSALLRQENRQGWLSVLPMLILEVLVCAFPIGMVITKSFTNWDGLYKNSFVGLRNYAKIFSDPTFWKLIRNTIIFLLTIPVQTFLGIAVAVILNEKMPGWKLFRLIYYLPSIVSATIIGYLYRIMFSFNGPVNSVFRGIGLESLAVEWLADGHTARLVVFLCLVWGNIGWQVLITFGGLANIPGTVFEAAELDGAGYWEKFLFITIPMLLRTVEYSFISAMIYIFSGIFALIHTISAGGPGFETTTIDYMVYVKGFAGSKLGQACALSVILLFIILIMTVAQQKLSDKLDDWGG